MEMFGVVEKWVAGKSDEERRRMLDGLSKEGVRAGRHHDTERQDHLGGHSTHAPGCGHGPAQPSSGGIGAFVQQAQGMFSNGQGLTGFVQQASTAFQGGPSGVGGFVQNIAGRREIVQEYYAPPDHPPPEFEESYNQSRTEYLPPRTPPREYGEEYRPPSQGYRPPSQGYGQPERPYLQPPHGYPGEYRPPSQGYEPRYEGDYRPPSQGRYRNNYGREYERPEYEDYEPRRGYREGYD